MSEESKKLKFIKSLYYPYKAESVYDDNNEPSFPSGFCVLIPASIYKIIGEEAFRKTLKKFPIYVLTESRYFVKKVSIEDLDISEVPKGNKVPIVRYFEIVGSVKINHVFTPIKWEDCPVSSLNHLLEDSPIAETGIKVLKEMLLDRLDMDPWELVIQIFNEFDAEGLYSWLNEAIFWAGNSPKLILKEK